MNEVRIKKKKNVNEDNNTNLTILRTGGGGVEGDKQANLNKQEDG